MKSETAAGGVFEVKSRDPKGRARSGVLHTPHGDVETPVFMPVATLGSVKALSQEDLSELKVGAILANSYHLYLRPGCPEIAAAGGLHKFMGYDGMILTDSGGFQVMSLADLREVDDHGVSFKSHVDGSSHRLTPESVIGVQAGLGSDCWTTLDVCPAYPCTEAEAAEALRRTMAWTDLSVPEVKRFRDQGSRSLLFPILQGSVYPELRERAAEHLASVPHDGVSLGGFSVGEPKELTWSTLSAVSGILPDAEPRYLMGVGTPEDVWEAAAAGADMMDCVFPTRVARNGQVFTRTGRYNISNAPSRGNFSPIDPECPCFVCRKYTRAYLRHLFSSRELVVYRLLTYHNLSFMLRVMGEMRSAIREGRFEAAKKEFLGRLAQGSQTHGGASVLPSP
ncbi:MAG: tRNA guanosine(34) transglycosylase Tgt [Elusimicrobia bacterium]|nr:tRNA guanosine(34) transglycosylase Tgt [Elusimicrobiota bacterium]